MLILYLILFLSVSCGESSQKILTQVYCDQIKELFYHKGMEAMPLPSEWEDHSDSSFHSYCENYLLNHEKDGNPKAWENIENKWELSHGSALLLSSYDQTEKKMPYVKRLLYKEVGECQLGMKIFVKDLKMLSKKKLKPALFIHGGGWKMRQYTANLAVDVNIPHLTEKDYMVFSPVHRLIGNTDGPKECQNATGKEIIEDIEDSLQWILDHKERFGLSNEKVALIGQSSGGHLATYLLTHHKEKIWKALLFYPVTDFSFILSEMKPEGLYKKSLDTYKNILLDFIGISYNDITKLNEEQKKWIEDNSFPNIIKNDPKKYPPFFIIHGSKDQVSPIESSVRLCQSASKKELLKTRFFFTEKDIKCAANNSSLHIIQGAHHMMDIKCYSKYFEPFIHSKMLEYNTCASGNKENEKILINILKEAYDSFL